MVVRKPVNESPRAEFASTSSGKSRKKQVIDTDTGFDAENAADYEAFVTVEYSEEPTVEGGFLGPLSLGDANDRLLPGIQGDHLNVKQLPAEFADQSFRIAAVPFRSPTPDAMTVSEFRPENIIGRDNRERIADVTINPFPWICFLNMTTRNGNRMIGTGWLAGPKTVVTAAHCVYNRDPRYGIGYMKRDSYKVYAGISGSNLAGTSEVENMFTTQQWLNSGTEVYDFAVLRLKTPLGNKGYFQFAHFDDSSLQNMLVNVAGYPYDKNSTSIPQMWGNADVIVGVERQRLSYLNDTLPGNSGGPVINWQNGGDMHVVGIHNYGGNSGNCATRINPAVFQQLMDWRL